MHRTSPRLSAFYTALAGWTETYADDEWITMTTDDGWRIGLQRAPDHVPPRWPDPAYPQQAHLDLRVPDLDGGDGRGRSSWAPRCCARTRRWHTLADPAGHPFDLCLAEDEPRRRRSWPCCSTAPTSKSSARSTPSC